MSSPRRRLKNPALPVEPRGKHPKHRMEWSLPAGLTNGSQPNMQDVEGRDVVLKASWQTESAKDTEKSMYMAGAGAFGTAVSILTRPPIQLGSRFLTAFSFPHDGCPIINRVGCIAISLEGEILEPLWPPASVDGTTIALQGLHIATESPSQTSAQIGKDINALIEKIEIGSNCAAFVTDDDLAVQWATYFDDEHKHAPRFVSTERATPSRRRNNKYQGNPRVSLPLHRAMLENTKYIQSPADDVQSFFWVMLWAVLFNNMDQKRCPREVAWRAEMEGADVRAKGDFTARLNREEFDPEFSGVKYSAVGVQLFPLLQAWWRKQRELEADWGKVLREAKRISPESHARFHLHHYHWFALRGVKEFLEIMDEYCPTLKSYGQFEPPSSSL
ncbi:hypothetical protein B0H16DRAFT_1894329 [Mycena metata]|uniref:Fungal-type protein kinase domain-containing protein n=1 Tax=Mycena metata TaxID=1033252 RepID=A0AAD7MQT9_9AGAR|nr:hypothetical protein B0H16DRAFT_1894329 [Mycena metata]